MSYRNQTTGYKVPISLTFNINLLVRLNAYVTKSDPHISKSRVFELAVTDYLDMHDRHDTPETNTTSE